MTEIDWIVISSLLLNVERSIKVLLYINWERDFISNDFWDILWIALIEDCRQAVKSLQNNKYFKQ